MYFGEEKYEKYNILPVNKFILPVNKENALKAGIINQADLPNVANQIMITYKGNTLYKNNLILMDLLANFDWKRPINFSSGVFMTVKIFSILMIIFSLTGSATD